MRVQSQQNVRVDSSNGVQNTLGTSGRAAGLMPRFRPAAKANRAAVLWLHSMSTICEVCEARIILSALPHGSTRLLLRPRKGSKPHTDEPAFMRN